MLLWVIPLLLLQTTNGPTLGQEAVALVDLEGAVIEARFLRQQTIIREGREVSNRFQNDLRIDMGPGGKIQQTISPTAYTKRGTRRGKTTSGSWTIGQVREVASRGGGHGVFNFADANLTFFRSFRGGAMKRVFAFTRGAIGLSCSATETFLHEEGVRGIQLDSALDNVPITILSSNPISANCRIAKQGRAP